MPHIIQPWTFLLASLLAPSLAAAQAQPAPGNGHPAAGIPAVPVGQAEGMRAEQPWARATAPQQKVGGAYVTLTSTAGDRLVGVSSPVAGRAGLHQMQMDGTIMRMRELPGGLALPAGQAVALAPGGYHIMLMDLKQPLVAGQVIPVQLRFQNAPPLDLEVKVGPAGASGPGAASGMAAGMPSGTGGHGAMPGHGK